MLSERLGSKFFTEPKLTKESFCLPQIPHCYYSIDEINTPNWVTDGLGLLKIIEN